MLTDWLDRDYQMHHKKNPTPDTSENEALFTGTFLVLNRYFKKVPPRFMAVNNWAKLVRSITLDEHVSHDNMTGVVAQRHTRGQVNRFPIWTMDRPHPRDIVMYGYASKYKWLYAPLLWIPSLAMIYSCATTWRKKPWGKELTTSGKMLALTRVLAFDMTITKSVCSWLIRRNPEFGSWYKVAKIYFKEEGHPIPIKVRELEDRGIL